MRIHKIDQRSKDFKVFYSNELSYLKAIGTDFMSGIPRVFIKED